MTKKSKPKDIKDHRPRVGMHLSPSADPLRDIISDIRHLKHEVEIQRIELEEQYQNPQKAQFREQQIEQQQKQYTVGKIFASRPSNGTLHQSQRELRIFAQSMIARLESDRRRISFQLHDTLAQGLATIKLFLESKLVQMSKEDLSDPFSIEAILEITRENLNEVRRLINELRPRILDDLGLLATIRWYRQEFLHRHPDIDVAIHLNATEVDIPARLKLPIYRVFQEAIDNIAAHDPLVNRIDFRLTRQSQTVRLEISDDGYDSPVAVRLEQALNPLILSVKCYTELSGGRFNLQSPCSRGTCFEATWNIEKRRMY